MSNVSKLLATDETFREVADLLYGGGADELISKMNPTQSDVAAQRKKTERRQAQVGLASNVVGLAAGAMGTKDAYKDYKTKKGTVTGRRLLTSTKVSGKTKALAGAALGLQVANVAGDAVANRVLARSAKKDPNVKGGATTAVRVANEKRKDIHKSLKPINKSLDLAKDIPESAGPGSGGKLTRVAPHQNPRQGKTAQKFSAGHFKKLPIAIKGGKGKKVSKSADVLDVRWEGEISKLNVEKRQVFGWASIVELNGEPVVDLQGDYIAIDEVEKSAYEYVHKSRKGGDMHLRDGDEPIVKSHMIESFVVTPEKKAALKLPDDTPVGWWVGYQINDDDLWGAVKDGKRSGFSIHGRGVRSPA